MDAFNWLHLTDLHWGLPGQEPLWPRVRERFFEDLAKLYPKAGPWHAVLFTGDLAQTGAAEEFARLEDGVLGPLWDCFAKLGCDPLPVLLAVPGNHDLQRPPADDPSPEVLWLLDEGGFQKIATRFWEDGKSAYRRVVTEAFANYKRWWGRRPHCQTQTICDGLLPGDFSTTITTAGGRHIGIVGLNFAFLQLAAGDYRQRLACHVRQLHDACPPNGPAWLAKHDLCLLLTHQPPEWLDGPSRDRQYPEINPAGDFAVHLFGHMHESALRGMSQGGGPVQRWWQSRSLFGMEHYGDAQKLDRRHGYSAGRLEFADDHVTLRHWPRTATLHQTNGWRFIPDHDQCVLDDDGGTKPESIPLRDKNAVGPTAVPAESLDALTDRVLAGYRQRVRREWEDRWSEVIGQEEEKNR